MLHEDWNLVVFVFRSRYFLNVMNESIMKPELKNTYRKSSSMNWKWGPLICNKYNRVSPTNHIQEDLIQLWQSLRHLKFDKEGDVFWAQMKPQLSQFAWYFPESWKYRGRCSPEIKRFFFFWEQTLCILLPRRHHFGYPNTRSTKWDFPTVMSFLSP